MAVEIRKKDKNYIDISLSFEPNPITGDLSLLTDRRAIENSLKNLILTMVGEVPFNRDVGSVVSSLVFEVNDSATASLVESEIKRAIRFSEPRVKLEDVVVESKPDEYAFLATIRYQIIGTEQVFIVQQILRPSR